MKTFEGKKIGIFGTGSAAKCITEKMANSVSFYIDNNPYKWNEDFMGKQIKSPKDLLSEEKNNLIIIVASMHYEEICQQLYGYGFQENINVFNMNIFVNPLNLPFEAIVREEYELLLEKVKTYLHSSLRNDVDQFIVGYENLIPLDERVVLIKNFLDNGYDFLDSHLYLLKDILPKYDVYFDYYLALKFEKEKSFSDALSLYEKILASGLNPSIKEKTIEHITHIYNHKISQSQRSIQKQQMEATSGNYYVHLMQDSIYSDKFIEYIKEKHNFDKHKFLIISYKKNIQYVHEKNLKEDNVYTFDSNTLSFVTGSELFLKLILESKKVLIHSLTDLICWCICRYNIDYTNLNWIIWGADLYSYIDVNIYTKLTENCLEELDLLPPSGNNSLTNEQLLYRKGAIRRLDNILTWNQGDYDLVRKHFFTTAKLKHFYYPLPVDHDSTDLTNTEKKCKLNLKDKFKYVLLLGNSASPNNNHLDIIYFLGELSSKNFCVVAPLSYGGPQQYVNKIIDEGRKILGDRFIPITEFLDPTDYRDILNQIDVSIMNHKRQAGVGNVISLLILGKKVFMNSEITTFSVFKNHGIALCSIQELFACNNIDEIISMDEYYKEKNIENLKQFYNETKLDYSLQMLFDDTESL
ncbi:hypothetical protein BHU72_00250 [Desulfuribacillus stibiiarsenatis]|uniref:Uncharacterized protein n=1 Tax=Desulfuribacillus stibiiarsenatis TaxID=1390249 RepID=A0A1E5L9A7_9FIRM|nr:TDP-N-acetylfucosamine:lipid II N-acetylfucosaminyltransferase [Desulfuribacillus stibiiarsenatis]OEH86742.1 hypothetical protein BHU72_00250 [Desulfuribacillus stibiiarsenatis]